MLSDIRYAVRTMTNNRLFSAVVIAILALGIGANAAIFSAVESIVLRPLPLADSNRLVAVWETPPRTAMRVGPSGPTYLDFKNQSASFEDLALLDLGSGTITGTGEPQQVPALRVTTNYLSVLGVHPTRGRDFHEGEGWHDRVVIVAYGFWQRNLGLATDVIGRRIMLDDIPYTIVGVTPKTFWSPFPSELLVPWDRDDLLVNPAEQRARSRTDHDFGVIGRLKRGTTVERGSAELSAIEQRIAQAAPQMAGWSVTVVPLHRLVAEHLESSLAVLLAAVGLVLLIACANIASLLVARAMARQHETAIRRALGANRWRLARQFLTESGALAAAGAAAGILVAMWGVDVLDRLLPSTLPLADGGVVARPPVTIDAVVFGFAAVVALATSIAFTLGPLFSAARSDVTDSIKSGTRTTATGHAPVRRLLIVAEIALALVLLIAAALTVKSVWRLQHVDPGFVPAGLLALEMELPTDSRYREGTEQSAFFSRVLDRMRTISGVESAAVTSVLPLDPTLSHGQTFGIVNRPPPLPGELPRSAERRSVSARYFQTLGIPLQRGRTFTDADRGDHPFVVIVDETLAHMYFGDADPVGQRLRIGRTDLEIVGVVGAVRQTGLDKRPAPVMYLSALQVPEPRMSLAVRTSVDPTSMIRAVKGAVYAVDPDQPVYRIRTMEQAVAEVTAPQRLTLMLLGLFAGAALCLASIGLYGLVAYTVVQRTREVGIRIALGADPRQIVRLIFSQGISATAVGIGVGLAISIVATRALASILYGVDVHDPVAFALAAVVLACVAAVSSYEPARRAAAIDPNLSLRNE